VNLNVYTDIICVYETNAGFTLNPTCVVWRSAINQKTEFCFVSSIRNKILSDCRTSYDRCWIQCESSKIERKQERANEREREEGQKEKGGGERDGWRRRRWWRWRQQWSADSTVVQLLHESLLNAFRSNW